MITYPDWGVPAPTRDRSPGGTAPIADPLAALPTVVYPASLLPHLAPSTQPAVTDGALADLTVRHPVVGPGAVLDDVDGKLQGGGQAAHRPHHGLPHLPHVDLVGLNVGPGDLEDPVLGGGVAGLADSDWLVAPAPLRDWSLVAGALRTEPLPTGSAVVDLVGAVKPGRIAAVSI